MTDWGDIQLVNGTLYIFVLPIKGGSTQNASHLQLHY